MSKAAQPLSQQIDILKKEGKRRVLLLASILSIVALTALALGIILPKRYDAQTLLVVETGTASKLIDRGGGGTEAANAQNALLAGVSLSITDGKKIQREMLAFGGWQQPPPAKQLDPMAEAQAIEKLRSRIKIDTAREGFVKISYWDNDADRTQAMVNKLGEVFIRETDEAQTREARDAMAFIENQVKEYGDKLAAAHQQVLSRNLGIETNLAGATPKASASADAPKPPAPRMGGGLSPEEIASLKTEKATLEAQLARKPAGSAINVEAENAARQRVAQLQAELDRLRAAFTEEHPDVKRVKRELATAKEDLAGLENSRRAKERDERNSEALDEEVRAAARTRLEAINKRLQSAGVVVPPSPVGRTPAGAAAAAASVAEPEMKNIGSDTTLAELVRRYDATREAYQELLKRRESARVTLDLVAQHHGLNVRVQEAAERPTFATGLRLSQICAIGLLLSVAIPFGVLFAIVKFDTRVRTGYQIEVMARVPLLVSIGAGTPSGSGASATAANQTRRQRTAIAMVIAVLCIYAAAFVLKTLK